MMRRAVSSAVVFGVLMVSAAVAIAAEPLRLQSTPCATPAVLHCPAANCPRDTIRDPGPATEMKTGRKYFLDYPCDLKKGEKVTFILSLHGAGSIGNWQRHYFPLLDYKDKYRLVIATPFSPTTTWSAADDEYLQNIVTAVTKELGGENIKAFWLVGHSQGGLTSNRLVCTDFFKSRVDGFLSLSGGRVGGSPQRGTDFGNLGRGAAPARGGDATATGRGAAPAAAPGAAVQGGAAPGAGRAAAGGRGPAPLPSCDFSHIFETGEHEVGNGLEGLPKKSVWAEKYQCSAEPKQSEVVDTKPGYVYDGGRQDPGSKGWGLLPRPGKAEIFTYKGCKDGRVVADIMRMDKGHTEGLEPRVTEEMVKLLVSARGGKIQKGS
jgi:pimeloyl-ACP methyl ester carboxylesterase